MQEFTELTFGDAGLGHATVVHRSQLLQQLRRWVLWNIIICIISLQYLHIIWHMSRYHS